jgi:hypothetical protein
MGRIELAEGTIIDLGTATELGQQSMSQHVSYFSELPTPAADLRQKLFKTGAGSYILVTMNAEGPTEVKDARRMNRVHACRWLLINGGQIPEDLKALAAELLE